MRFAREASRLVLVFSSEILCRSICNTGWHHIDTRPACGASLARRCASQSQRRVESQLSIVRGWSLDLRIHRQMAMGVIAIFPLIRKPTVGPNLGGAEDQLPGPQKYAHRVAVGG